MDSITPSSPEKQCPACENWYPRSPIYFGRDKGRKDGLCHYCKECNRKKAHKHYQEHPEYYQEYSKSHSEQINQHTRKYRKTEHGKIILHAAYHKRRAQKQATEGTLTSQQIQDKLRLQHFKCYYCHDRFKKCNGRYIYHLDHTIPLSRPEHKPRHDMNYTVLTCRTCNLKKHDKLPHEFFEGGRLF